MAKADARAAKFAPMIRALLDEGLNLEAVAMEFNRRGLRGGFGARFSRSTVHSLLNRKLPQ